MWTLSTQPDIGALIEGSGGFRKFRIGREGMGKSGGLRVITYWTSEDVPAFLMTVYGKSRKDDLTDAEVSALARRGRTLIADYSRNRR